MQPANTPVKRREFLAAAARAGLTLSAAGTVRPLWATVQERTVRGRVTGDGRPLAGVLVSDGRRIVPTNRRGEYELAIGADSGRFIFVTAPRGFWADAFYAPIGKAAEAGRADFALRAIDQPDRFDFVFMADMHISKRPWGPRKLRASLREINKLDPTPAFLLAQGDICLQKGQGKDYLECLGLLKIPVRNGPGNHEMLLGQRNPRDRFEQLFGPTYHSFDWGTVHVIVLDGNKVIRGLGIHGAVEGSELEWLKADLAAQPQGKPIIVGVHIPIVSTYPARCPELNRDHAPLWELANEKVLTKLFSQHRVRLVLQGHAHENERITVGHVEYVSSISVSGRWWAAGEGFERGVDGCPRGYRIVSVDGTKITHRYRASCESYVDRQGEFVGLPGGVRAGKETRFLFNCYDAPNGSTAQARIDAGPWQPMSAFGYRSPSYPVDRPHHFRLVTDTTALAPGTHTVEARVTWPDGTVVVEEETVEVVR